MKVGGPQQTRGEGLCGVKQPRGELAGVLLALAAHAAITLPLAWLLNIWIDEAYTLATTGNGPLEATRRGIGFELQPPLYFTLLGAWRGLSSSLFHARLFSTICSLGAILAAVAAFRAWLPRTSAVSMAWVLALHPFTVWAAVEARCYALVLLLASGLLLAFARGYLGPEPRRPARVGLVLLAVASLYTQYYLGFLLFGLWVVLLCLRRWRQALDYLVAMVVVGALFAPLLTQTSHHFGAHANPDQLPFSIRGAFWYVVERLGYYAAPDWLTPGALFAPLRWGLLAVLVGTCAVAALRQAREWIAPDPAGQAPRTLPLGALVGTLAAFLFVLLATGGEDIASVRHSGFFLLPILLLVAAGAVESRIPSAWGLLAALLCLWNAGVLWQTYTPRPAKFGDWIQVARTIEAGERPGQAILVFRAPLALPLAYHYRGQSPIVPVPQPASTEVWDMKRFAISSEAEVEAACAGRSEVWLVTDLIKRHLGVDFRRDLLENVLSRDFDEVSSQAFRGVDLRLFRRKPR